ncbi:hypothetical protein BOTBODRAFT_33932 [Botryobasidium botryosum FD-172 SS1]|uniref:ZZ-type domain-containing protein n=1 Tax=Botryobasidium botryosum (strain FD-172 SS1) TaxID=930990 RepID=A0A067MME5_BOTB1|nr:hypothetical protein BOTBODRAFT_33932 [Botryobasidium botryosum FD-172 SS1]
MSHQYGTFTDRPDRPLVIKCAFDRSLRRITFASAQNCSYNLMRSRVEQCFALSASSFTISYTDDDGEVTDITSDDDLGEAIEYFQAGIDDSGSLSSGRSSSTRKITVRVQVAVDYDGPCLSDTASLASLDEYPRSRRHNSDESLSLGSLSSDFEQVQMDDDAVTVSSRDNGTAPSNGGSFVNVPPSRAPGNARAHQRQQAGSSGYYERSILSQTQSSSSSRGLPQGARATRFGSGQTRTRSPLPSSIDLSESSEADYSIVDASRDERELDLEPPRSQSPESELPLESEIGTESSVVPEDPSPPGPEGYASAFSLHSSERGAQWLRDQNARALRSMIGALPEPSVTSDESSVAASRRSFSSKDGSSIRGDLELQKDMRGKYYYEYTSDAVSSSAASQSGVDYDDARTEVMYPSHDPEISPEQLRHFPVEPPTAVTDCSSCGVLLDSFRYVCATCGEKKPRSKDESSVHGKGKQKAVYGPNGHLSAGYRTSSAPALPIVHPIHEYPPRAMSHSVSPASSSSTLVGSFTRRISGKQVCNKPLPKIPTSPSQSGSTLVGSYSSNEPLPPLEVGYELCMACIEDHGVKHAVESAQAMNSVTPTSGSPASSPDDTRTVTHTRQSSLRRKGQVRHAFKEQIWGVGGWKDVEQDDYAICSICDKEIKANRHKCVSCQSFNLCLPCYSQVHEIHPSHTFLTIPERPAPVIQVTPAQPSSVEDEESLKHPGVFCCHCMQDIVGARFHCVTCASVDLCANCEAAGVPGTMDGGHDWSHIMIKIPRPLESPEVLVASQRARNLWQVRDAPTIGGQLLNHRRRSSSGSDHAQTVVGIRPSPHPPTRQNSFICRGCHNSIDGIRYQCATCPSIPTTYNLCAQCETRSHMLHDAMHVFLKIPRPLNTLIQSAEPIMPSVYKRPVGQDEDGNRYQEDAREYLQNLEHPSTVCDNCISKVRGEWYRCAHCGADYCENCEHFGVHDPNHIFVVFKSAVDMNLFASVVDLPNPSGSLPLLHYPVYASS